MLSIAQSIPMRERCLLRVGAEKFCVHSGKEKGLRQHEGWMLPVGTLTKEIKIMEIT